MNGTKPKLNLYIDKKVVATLMHSDKGLLLQYCTEWQKTGFALSPHLPLNNNIPEKNVENFLRNLLPEGYGFDELVRNFHISKSNTFALIRALGRDISGAIMAVDSDQRLPETPSFRPLKIDELEQRLNHRDEMSLIMWDEKPRLSSAGIQDKINIMLTPENEMGFGEGSLASTHILKFERKGQSHLVLNEYISMRLAELCGLITARTRLIRIGKHLGLLVDRFDRKLITLEEVKRRHLIDGCQALNLPPEYKYERIYGDARDVAHIRDGASLEKLFEFAKTCENPAITILRLLDWVLFNILIFNSDAHGKNLSFFMSSQGIELAPFYDLVNIKMFPNFNHKMAMAVGDEFELDKISFSELVDFADSCNLKSTLIVKQLKFMASQLIWALDQYQTNIILNDEEHQYSLEYKAIVLQRCKHLLSLSNQ